VRSSSNYAYLQGLLQDQRRPRRRGESSKRGLPSFLSSFDHGASQGCRAAMIRRCP
jgi:hypothetical protein